MQSYYGVMLNHRSRHRELLRQAKRDRLANGLLRRHSAVMPLDPPAGRTAGRKRLVILPVGTLGSAEQA